MKLENEKVNLVIDDKSPAKKVLTQAFTCIQKNWDQSKADMMEMVIGTNLDIEESDVDSRDKRYNEPREWESKFSDRW